MILKCSRFRPLVSKMFCRTDDSALRKPLSVAIPDAIQSDEWTEVKVRYLDPAAANSS
jgi:hypothetical protein